MPSPDSEARQTMGRRLVVSMVVLGLLAHSVGCSSTPLVDRKPRPEISAAAPTTPSEQAPREMQQRGGAASKPRRWSWQKSKLRRTIRRGTYATEEGTKEVAKVAGIAALCTVAAAAFGALLYLDLRDDGCSCDTPSDF
jgi:hypothetical protein